MSTPIVIKIGTGVLTQDDGTLDGTSLVKLVTGVAALQAAGHSCIMVSSGAVGAGVSALGLNAYPEDLDTKQAAAAVGQARLMQTYETLFQNFDLHVAQLLLTGSDLAENRDRVLATLTRLLEERKIIPIINENDSVAVEELKVGDNDMLSARVAALIGASQLILLTGVDGLMPPDGNEIIEEVSDVNDVLDFARDESGKFSIGGMASKLQAVAAATIAGISVTIANGRNPEQLLDLVEGKGRGTRFTV
ncbi:MAG: glutamate 5-kinase [Akkermansiaceae bacterium]